MTRHGNPTEQRTGGSSERRYDMTLTWALPWNLMTYNPGRTSKAQRTFIFQPTEYDFGFSSVSLPKILASSESTKGFDDKVIRNLHSLCPGREYTETVRKIKCTTIHWSLHPSKYASHEPKRKEGKQTFSETGRPCVR